MLADQRDRVQVALLFERWARWITVKSQRANAL
jgi:hypothetical protein